MRPVPASHDLAQGLGQELGDHQILLAGLSRWQIPWAGRAILIQAMVGRIKRQQRLASVQVPVPEVLPVCPVCGREIPPSEQDAHHFVPKSKGGRETRLLHRICHRQIHALYGETELARRLHTAEALLAEPEMQKFVAWVRRKPMDFFEKSRKSVARRRA